MTLLNEVGDRLARRVQRGLVRAGLNDIAVLSIDPEQGRALVLRHGTSMHRIEVQPYERSPEASRSPALGWLPLLVTSSFDEATFWELVDAGVSLLDDRGNAHLVLDGNTVLFAHAPDPAASRTSGREPATDRAVRRQVGPAVLALSRSSHQVAFALLAEPSLARAPLRELAAAAGVSVGTVHKTVNELRAAGHLVKDRLREAGRLLDTWAAAFQRLAVQPLTQRPLYVDGVEWIDQLALDPVTGALAGGAAAAGVLTGHVRATEGISYVTDVGATVKLLRLAPTPTPYRVELRQKFWGEDLPAPRAGFVPSVLLYGDLLRDGDDRSLETARFLREHDAHLRALDRG